MSQSSPVDIPHRQHFTISFEQIHQIGLDGVPESDHVRQRIEATEPMEHFPYMFDAASRGDVDPGPTCAGVGTPYLLTVPGIQAVDLFLGKRLAAGEQTDIEYTTWFNYQAPPSPELKRQLGMRAMEKLDITVRFHSEHLPRAVWWTEWTGDVGDDRIKNRTLFIPTPVDRGPHDMCEVRTVQHDIAARSIIGFSWEWE